MTLTEFLLARIAEDEAGARQGQRHGGVQAAVCTRVLAECEAKRRIVELHADGGRNAWIGDRFVNWCTADKATWPCQTLRLLALPYTDHPGFDPVWRI